MICKNLCLQKFPTLQYLCLMSWGESRQGGRRKERGGGRGGDRGEGWSVEGWKRLCVSGDIVGNGVVRVLREVREVGKGRVGDRRG